MRASSAVTVNLNIWSGIPSASPQSPSYCPSTTTLHVSAVMLALADSVSVVDETNGLYVPHESPLSSSKGVVLYAAGNVKVCAVFGMAFAELVFT